MLQRVNPFEEFMLQRVNPLVPATESLTSCSND